MKVDPHLTLVKKLEGVDNRRQRQARAYSQGTLEGVVLLVSQENRRASRLSPNSLGEAKELLEKVRMNLEAAREETLVEVHRLEAHCLVRLW